MINTYLNCRGTIVISDAETTFFETLTDGDLREQLVIHHDLKNRLACLTQPGTLI